MKLKLNLPFVWGICLIILASSCSLFDKEDENPETTKLTSIEIGETVEVISSTISTSGGSIKITKPDTPVDGMEISIPANSFSTPQTFKISYSEIKSHDFGQYFNPISPMITVSYDGGYSSELMSLTIPAIIPKGHIPLGFYLDESTGKLEGIPVQNFTPNSITLLTRHFMPGNKLHTGAPTLKSANAETGKGANIIISSISESVLNLQPVIASGFKPGVDDWEFSNRGSYIAPGGHCAGQNMAAMWYYFEKKAGESNLFNKFSDNPNLWQANARGYRFCSVIHNDLDWGAVVPNLFDKFIDKNQELDKLKLYTIAGTMLVTGEPQGIGIYRSIIKTDGTPGFGGHDLICYQVSVSSGKLYISDPNTPGTGQIIEFANDRFLPYLAKINAEEVSEAYPFVTYYAKTAYIEWDKIGKRYSEITDNTIGTVAPNTFPAYKIWVKDGAGYELKDGLIMTKDTLHSFVEGPNTVMGYEINGKILLASYVYDKTGKRIDCQEGTGNPILIPKPGLYVKLKPGLNKLGYYVVGWRSSSKYTSGANNGKHKDKFIDFKWVTVNYIPLSIDPNPLQGLPDKEYILTAKSKGAAPTSSKYIWDFGDGSSKVTVLNDSTVKYTYTKEGTFNVKVELYDNSANKKLTDATSVAEISKNVVSTKSFSFNWVTKSVYTGGFTVNYGVSGTVNGLNGNKVLDIYSNQYVKGNVEVEFSEYGAFKINFNSSFTVSPSKRDTTFTDGSSQTVSYNGSAGMKWMTQSFSPYTFFATSGGTFENSKSFGSIDIWGYFEEKIEKFDKDKKLIETKTGMVTFPLMLLEFDKQ